MGVGQGRLPGGGLPQEAYLLQRYLVGAGLCLCLSLQVHRSQSGSLTGLGPGSHTTSVTIALGKLLRPGPQFTCLKVEMSEDGTR